MTRPKLSDAVLHRRFDLRKGGHVDIHLWQPAPAGQDYSCAYKIVGLNHNKLYRAYGVDSVQAMHMALRLISNRLYASPEYLTGDLTYLDQRDLDLPLMPGQIPGSEAYVQAQILAPGGGSTAVILPGDKFAYAAFPGWRLDNLIKRLDRISEDMATGDPTANARLTATIATLKSEQAYYESLCDRAALDLSYNSPAVRLNDPV